jgi:hypothetical protein
VIAHGDWCVEALRFEILLGKMTRGVWELRTV